MLAFLRSRRARARLGALTAFGFAVLPSASPAAVRPDFCNTSDPIAATALAQGVPTASCPLVGRLVLGTGASAGVYVPPPGHGVTAEVTRTTGDTELSVETSPDGVVRAIQAAPALAGIASVANSPSACSDPAYATSGRRQGNTYHWYYFLASAPSSLDNTDFEVTRAAINMARGYNDCGESRSPRAYQSYDGTRNVQANIDGNGRCVSTSDGINMVSWASISDVRTLAVTCLWYSGTSYIDDADIKINQDPAWFSSGSPPAGCGSLKERFDVQGDLTHEFGHVFGLSHVSEASHAALTMSELEPSCSTSDRTLGRGDLNGMFSVYGSNP